MKFLATKVQETDRKTILENNIRHEEVEISVRLISSGNTEKFSTGELLRIILEKLREIEPTENTI